MTTEEQSRAGLAEDEHRALQRACSRASAISSTVAKTLLADLVPLVQAQQGTIYQMGRRRRRHGRPLQLLAGYAQRPGQPGAHPARRRDRRPVRAREASASSSTTCRRIIRSSARAWARPRPSSIVVLPPPLRGPHESGHRAGVAAARSLPPTSSFSISSRRASASC